MEVFREYDVDHKLIEHSSHNFATRETGSFIRTLVSYASFLTFVPYPGNGIGIYNRFAG